MTKKEKYTAIAEKLGCSVAYVQSEAKRDFVPERPTWLQEKIHQELGTKKRPYNEQQSNY